MSTILLNARNFVHVARLSLIFILKWPVFQVADEPCGILLIRLVKRLESVLPNAVEYTIKAPFRLI